jgi:bacillolysin
MNVFVYNPNGSQGYLGVDENNTESLIVYPNPSKNGMYSVDTGGTQFEYTIYSLDGKIITQGLSNGRINLEKQPKGIYILGVTTSKETFKSKLVID